MLEQVETNLWRVESGVPGMKIRRVMTVARRKAGDLVVHSAIRMDEAGMDALRALGDVRTIIVPNGYHRLDAVFYKEAFPAAKVLCPEGSAPRVQKVVHIDGFYETLEDDGEVSLDMPKGVKKREGVMFVRSGGELSLVFNDLVFNMPHASGFGGFLLRYITGSSGGFKTTRLSRLGLIADKRTFADELRRYAAMAPKRIIVSHHQMIEDDAAGALEAVADSLGG